MCSARLGYALEDLEVYKKVLAAARAISELTERVEFRDDPNLRQQLRAASAGVAAQIAEGHGQKTDRYFAHFLYVTRGTAEEVRAHLTVAVGRRHLTQDEGAAHASAYEAIARMLTGLVRHLEQDNRRQCG